MINRETIPATKITELKKRLKDFNTAALLYKAAREGYGIVSTEDLRITAENLVRITKQIANLAQELRIINKDKMDVRGLRPKDKHLELRIVHFNQFRNPITGDKYINPKNGKVQNKPFTKPQLQACTDIIDHVKEHMKALEAEAISEAAPPPQYVGSPNWFPNKFPSP